MRIGLLSDVHANHSALQAVLGFLEDRGAERLLVAGDLVGYGGRPNECVELLAGPVLTAWPGTMTCSSSTGCRPRGSPRWPAAAPS